MIFYKPAYFTLSFAGNRKIVSNSIIMRLVRRKVGSKVEQENQREENQGYPLPPRSTIHHVKKEDEADRHSRKWPVILGSIIFIVILAVFFVSQFPGDDPNGTDNLVSNSPNSQQKDASSDLEEEPVDTNEQSNEALEGQENPVSNEESTTQEMDDSNVSEEGGFPREETIHVVKSGENLFRISLEYYGSGEYVEALATYNGLENANEIFAGLKLKIPDQSVLAQ